MDDDAEMGVGASGDVGVGLLERADTLEQLAACLDDARRGHGRAVLIGADAGAGKTSVTREFCRRLDATTSVLAGACDPLSTPRPLGPFHDLGPRGRAPFEAGAVEPSAAAVFGCLRELLGEQTTVLVLEDLHWADEATLDVMRLLVRRIETFPTLVIGTFRDDELRRDHPLRTMLGDVATASGLRRLELQPLSLDAVTTLAAGSGLDPVALHARTAGNPFFVTEAIASGQHTVPTTVRDAALSRAAQLPSVARDLLDLIALAPPRAEAWLVEAITGDDRDTLDACLASGLVTIDERGIQFRHELSRLAVEHDVAPTRRIALHRGILAVLQERTSHEIDEARLAHHAEGAEDAGAVLRHAPRAARQAAQSGSYREAAAQYRRALRFASALPDGDRADLLEGLSRACYLADDQVAAIDEVRRAVDCRRGQGDAALEARALIELAGYLSCRGHLTESREVAGRAIGLVDGLPEASAHGLVYEFEARMRDDLPIAARLELADRARSIGERFGDGFVVGHATSTLGSLTMTHDTDRGTAVLEGLLRRADADGTHDIGARALNALAATSAMGGNRIRAAEYATRAIAYCTEHMQDLWRINALAIAARNALELGRWDEAIGYAEAILADPRDSPWPHHEALLVLALVRARRGDPGATAATDRAEAVGVPLDEVTAHVDLAAARAEIAWTERRLEDVDRVTAEAIDAALVRGDEAAVARMSFWRRMAELADEHPDAAWPWTPHADGSPSYESTISMLLTRDEPTLREAHEVLLRVGALPASRIAARRLRDAGARDIEVGPRRATQQHPAGLTPRERDVVELLAEGLRNSEIADRLVISRRTVDHHVAAIMRKVDARTRGEAVARVNEIELALG